MSDDSQREVPPPKDPSKVFAIAGLYYQGLTVPEDKAKAAALYQLSADRGYEQAMVRYGIMLMEGDGVEQDYVEAAKYIKMAADRGNANAMFLLATMYTDGKGVDRIPHMAAHYCYEAAMGGNLGAMVELAIWYRDGLNYIKKDMKQCLYWLIKASLEKYPPAMYELGCMYAFGESVERDVENGKALLQHAALAGDPDAEEALVVLEVGGCQRP